MRSIRASFLELAFSSRMKKILPTRFFDRPTLIVAKDLLGKFLVRKIGQEEVAAMITEVEAYVGSHDLASHASRGKTKRTEVMFGKAGYWYVYLIYGMYHCLNIVTEKEGYPAAILIRSVAGIKGPGRVCRYFRISKEFNKKPATRAAGLWIEDRGVKIMPCEIQRGKRVGVEYAGKWKKKLWRLYLAPESKKAIDWN